MFVDAWKYVDHSRLLSECSILAVFYIAIPIFKLFYAFEVELFISMLSIKQNQKHDYHSMSITIFFLNFEMCII